VIADGGDFEFVGEGPQCREMKLLGGNPGANDTESDFLHLSGDILVKDSEGKLHGQEPDGFSWETGKCG
jgi:hypothetical protein